MEWIRRSNISIIVAIISIVIFWTENVTGGEKNARLIATALLSTLLSIWLTCKLLYSLNTDSLKFSTEIFKQYLSINNFEEKPSTPSRLQPDILNRISTIVEKKYISSWYNRYVSEEISFPFACKELSDTTVSKIAQAASNIDGIHLTIDILTIVLRHLKEYKRAVKRFNKCSKGSISDYYKSFHPCFNKNNASKSKIKSTQNHCLYIIRTILKELLPWELWDSPHSTLLAAVLTKRLDYFLCTLISDSTWLKSCMWTFLNSEETLTDNDLLQTFNDFSNPVNETSNINKNDMFDFLNKKNYSTSKITVESISCNIISNNTVPLQNPDIEDNIKNSSKIIISEEVDSSKYYSDKTVSKPVDIVTSNRNLNSNEVKIYDRLIEGSVKTWNSDVDLECVSLGQDLLASLDGEIQFESRLGRLWEADACDANEIWSPIALSTGEEDNLDMELNEESPPKSTVQTNTSHSNFNLSKPFQNIKELQNISKNTMNSAKTKIGDLQDEAAGVMEGILDFGIAGFKKGLQLTRFQDNPPSNLHVPSISRKNSQSDIELSKKAENTKITSSNHHLLKQQKVLSQDNLNMPYTKRENTKPIPIVSSIMNTANFDEDSPDYEYEEAEDLPSTIAKLRCLLQQKTNLNAEETSQEGINEKSKTISVSISPNDLTSSEIENEFTVVSQNSIDFLSVEDKINFNPMPNNIQIFDKLFTKTVTGVFNTIKTAVGGDALSEAVPGHSDPTLPVNRQLHRPNWIFIENDTDISVLVGRLLAERRGYCVVEAAQDSLDMLRGTNIGVVMQEDRNQIQDELDESDVLSKHPMWQICTELIAEILGGAAQKDIVLKCSNAIIGDIMENSLKEKLHNFKSIILKKMTEELTSTNIDVNQQIQKNIDSSQLCTLLIQKIPRFLILLIGQTEIYKALELLISIVDHQRITQDLVFNLLDVFVFHFLKSCILRSDGISTPPPSA